MKRILCIFICFLCLCSSALSDVDLPSMSFESLAALRDQILREMMSRDEWQEVVVPVGTYQVGKHIPAGHWIIAPVEGAYSFVTIGGTLEDNGKDIEYKSAGYYHANMKSSSCRIYNAGDPTFVDLELKDGMFICIEKASVLFSPYSGQPDFGFSFK